MSAKIHPKYREIATRHLRDMLPGQTIPGEQVEQAARLLQDIARSLPRKRKPRPKIEQTVYINITFSRLSDGTGELIIETNLHDYEANLTTEPSLETVEDIIAAAIEELREHDDQRPEIDNEE